MCKNLIVLALTFACLGLASAQIFQTGRCPSRVQALAELNVADYLGTWYEYAKYPTSFQKDGICVKAEYSLREDGNVGVNNTQVNSVTGEFDAIEGYAYVVEGGKLNVVFPNAISFGSSNYWVLDTDYTSYSVVYSCQSLLGLQRATFVWILTRERFPAPETIQIAQQVLVDNGVSLDELTITDQENCN